MTSRSAAVYAGGGVLLVACLAAANMPQEPDPAMSRTWGAPRATGPDAVAVEINAQAERLRTLMAQAPPPGTTTRNPFSFGEPRAARTASVEVRAASAADQPVPPFSAPLPPLMLVGMAEETTPAGPRRTAVISGDADTIYMVGEGDAVGERYRVTKIGVDAVELEDVVSKAYRRLALR
jgi:hypothetical protein